MAAPTITGYSDFAPVPRVVVFFPSSALASGTETITVRQLSEDGQLVVRDGERLYAVGGATITDFEVPLGVPVQYLAEQFNSAGASLGFTDAATVQVNISERVAVVQDPLDPGLSVIAGTEAGFAETFSVQRDMKLHMIGFDVVALMGARGLARDVPLSVYTETDAQRKTLGKILENGYVLFRTMPAYPIPRCLHVVVGNSLARPFDARYGGDTVVWPITGNQVTRSELRVIVPTVSWQDVIDTYPTWSALIAANATWLDLQRNLTGV